MLINYANLHWGQIDEMFNQNEDLKGHMSCYEKKLFSALLWNCFVLSCFGKSIFSPTKSSHQSIKAIVKHTPEYELN